jgi:uncharacterized MnhB-related membrane protein
VIEQVLMAATLVLVAFTGAVVALTRDPLRQAITGSIYGLLLSVLFILMQAPDVALSQIVVGAVGLPLIVLLALSKIQGAKR